MNTTVYLCVGVSTHLVVLQFCNICNHHRLHKLDPVFAVHFGLTMEKNSFQELLNCDPRCIMVHLYQTTVYMENAQGFLHRPQCLNNNFNNEYKNIATKWFDT